MSALGNLLKILGKFNARLKLHGRENSGPCYVAASNLNVLGSDWLDALDLWNVPIASICNSSASSISASRREREVKLKFPSLFADSLGCCNKMKVSLTLKPGSQPVFRNKRPVPFAAAEEIANELKRLQLLGVISPVEYSQYVAPLVAVKKGTVEHESAPIILLGLTTPLNRTSVPCQHRRKFSRSCPSIESSAKSTSRMRSCRWSSTTMRKSY